MAYEVSWSLHALKQAQQIIAFIGQDSEHYADVVAGAIGQAAIELAENPHIGRMVPEYARPDIRERIIYSYRMIYRISGSKVRVVVVIHGARDLPARYKRPPGTGQ